jgi:hypothetical protein
MDLILLLEEFPPPFVCLYTFIYSGDYFCAEKSSFE